MYDPPAPFPDLEQLSATERFQQALTTENPRLIRSAAAQLPAIGIAEAAAMLLVIARTEPDNYERVALGWIAKLASESPRIDLRGITLAAEALDALPHRPSARATLAEVCRNAGDPHAAMVFGAARRFRATG